MRRATAAVAVLLIGVLGACGGGGSDAADDPDPSVTSGATEPAAKPAGDAEAVDLCTVLTADDIASVVGAPVTLETGPFDACEFDQEDVRALSGSLGTQPLADLGGGFSTYKAGAAGGFTDAQTVDLGAEGFVTTGFVGGENYQGAGAMTVDGLLLTINISQGVGLSRDEVVDQCSKLLSLAASKL